MKRILVALLFAATSLVAAPQAIVFDFGGVLTGEPNREAVVAFIRDSFTLSKEEFEIAQQEKRLFLKQGGNDEAFWLSYAKTKRIDLPSDWPDSFQAILKESVGVNPRMFALVEELKAKQIPVGLLSNIDARLAKLIRNFGFYDLFDPCLLSCEIGIEKPDPKAYQHLLDHLALPVEDVVFIDDRQENVDAAREAGVDALLFESEAQLRKELAQRGVLEC